MSLHKWIAEDPLLSRDFNKGKKKFSKHNFHIYVVIRIQRSKLKEDVLFDCS